MDKVAKYIMMRWDNFLFDRFKNRFEQLNSEMFISEVELIHRRDREYLIQSQKHRLMVELFDYAMDNELIYFEQTQDIVRFGWKLRATMFVYKR